MKKIILFFLLLGLSVWAGVLISRDPGYVLIAYQKNSVEMPLWLALVGLIISFFIFYYALRILVFIRSSGRRLSLWLKNYGEKKSRQLTAKGLVLFSEGEWLRAERYLVKGAARNENPLINYLTAARAAQELGDNKRRDDYLARAQAVSPREKLAVELNQAQLQINSGQLESALVTLTRLHEQSPKQRHVLKVLQGLLVQLQQWDRLAELLPAIRKYEVLSSVEYQELEKMCYRGLMDIAAGHGDLSALHAAWEKVPRHGHHDVTLVCRYVRSLIAIHAFDEAQTLIYKTLKLSFDDELVTLYGIAIGAEPAKQLTKAQAWLNDHPNDPYLLLTLGRLSMRNQLWGKARAFFENSLALLPLAQTYDELAKLNEQLGEKDAASALYREGLQKILLRTSTLPVAKR